MDRPKLLYLQGRPSPALATRCRSCIDLRPTRLNLSIANVHVVLDRSRRQDGDLRKSHHVRLSPSALSRIIGGIPRVIMSLLCLLPTRSVLCLPSYYKVLFPILLGIPQLSCKQCQSRKSKCNKQTPCSACQKAGTQCDVVQRARFPRGRSGKTKDKTAALEPRIARLEALVHQHNATG